MPDGAQKGPISKIMARFEEMKGFKLVGAKLFAPGRAHFEKHYTSLSDWGLFKHFIDHALSGPIFAKVWEGDNVVAICRKILAANEPFESEPGTILGD